MLIQNLSCICTAGGFLNRDGRNPRAEDCGALIGPIDLAINDSTGTIAAIGQDLPASGSTIDGTNLLALPGFIDPHTHSIFGGDRSREYFMRWAGRSYVEITEAGGGIHSTVRATTNASDADLARDLRSQLRNSIRHGVTTIEVKSGYGGDAQGELRLLRIIKSISQEVGIPEIVPSFLALHALPKGRDEPEFVDEMIAILPQVAKEKLARQVDSFPEKGFFTLESAMRFSQAAAKVGLAAKVHADELCDLGSSEAFAKFGALSIDHLQHISDAAVNMLKTSRTVATMLPATSFFVGIPYANARRLVDAGARVALATDFNPGTAPANDLQLTHMLAASQMKMSAAEILCASTFNAAAAIGLEKTHGTIAPGMIGNVLLFEVEGVRSTDDAMQRWEQIIIARKRPDQVIARGRLIDFPPTHT